MPITRVDVCDLIHTHLEGKLELVSSCSIVLSHNVQAGSILDEVAGASNLPTFNSLWVQQESRLRISITLVLDAVTLDTQMKEDFVSQIAIALKDAELWRQLGLQASFTFPIGPDIIFTNFKRIEFTILHSEVTDSTARGLEIQIMANTNPPGGVPTADLQEISIIWAFSPMISSSSNHSNKRLHYETLMVAGNNMSLLNDNDTYRHHSLSQSSVRLPALFWDMKCCHIRSPSESITSCNSEWTLNEVVEDHKESTVLSGLSAQAFAPQSLQQPQSPHTCQKRSRSFSNPLFNSIFAQELINVAFHEIVSGKNTPKISTEIQAKNEVGPRLVDISPAIFSPGYREAVSCQRQSISTIAYSLASVNRRTNSRPLREAFALLWITRPTTIMLSGESPPPDAQAHSEDLASIIKVRTWMIMQRLLFTPSKARRPRPLACRGSQSAEEMHEMLDEYSSPVTLAKTPEATSSPAIEMLDDHYSRDDFESLLEESDNDCLLSEDDENYRIWDNHMDQEGYTLNDNMGAKHHKSNIHMPQSQHHDFCDTDQGETRKKNDRAHPEIPDMLGVLSNIRSTDDGHEFEALAIQNTPGFDRVGLRIGLPHLEAGQKLDDRSVDDGTTSNSEELLDTMEILDSLSVDNGGGSFHELRSEPDEMLDTLSSGDEEIGELPGNTIERRKLLQGRGTPLHYMNMEEKDEKHLRMLY